uniref:Uncharacterized protein n=1 Tax=virus sp. ctLl75 TaxID=2828249 RepID=A0A8S5RAQ7_9VIRU|nr:MAG TPA: hypothetical protein [virus sp. ctLl75]
MFWSIFLFISSWSIFRIRWSSSTSTVTIRSIIIRCEEWTSILHR